MLLYVYYYIIFACCNLFSYGLASVAIDSLYLCLSIVCFNHTFYRSIYLYTSRYVDPQFIIPQSSSPTRKRKITNNALWFDRTLPRPMPAHSKRNIGKRRNKIQVTSTPNIERYCNVLLSPRPMSPDSKRNIGKRRNKIQVISTPNNNERYCNGTYCLCPIISTTQQLH